MAGGIATLLFAVVAVAAVDPGKVVILSHSYNYSTSVYDTFSLVRSCYAARHGYRYHEDHGDGRGFPVYFAKVFIVADALAERGASQADWVVWMDADATPVALSQPLTSFLPSSHDFVAVSYYNTGSLFGNWFFTIRRSSWSTRFMILWKHYSRAYHRCLLDQATMLLALNDMLAWEFGRPLTRCRLRLPSPCTGPPSNGPIWWCVPEDTEALLKTASSRHILYLPYHDRSGHRSVGGLPPHRIEHLATAFLAHVKHSQPCRLRHVWTRLLAQANDSDRCLAQAPLYDELQRLRATAFDRPCESP